MSENINEILYRVGEEVLEKLAFLFSFPADDDDDFEEDGAVSAKVAFTGPFTGSVVMSVSDSALPELAENMLGFEENEETSTEQQYDALKELINVICGNLLPAIAGKQEIFNVEMPIVLNEDESYEKELGTAPLAEARLALDMGQCRVFLYVDGGLPDEFLK